MAGRYPWILLAGAAALLSTPVLADVKAGVDAWSRGEYPLAIREWQGPAESGDPDALFNLGKAYQLGRGVKPDLARAEQLFGQAAAKGHLAAADLYGLLLFQRGERARALPYVIAAADRGDPRAQYLLGVAHFNGDGVAKDWVQAYALTSLAVQAGVIQAKGALAQMDQYIPLAQRQQAAALAPQLASRAEETRAHQVAAIDLGASAPAHGGPAPALVQSRHAAGAGAQQAPQHGVGSPRQGSDLATQGARSVADDSPRTAGADYARPQVAPVASPVESGSASVAARSPHAQAARAAPLVQPSSRQVAGDGGQVSHWSHGHYSVQLGAFAVAGNAVALWDRVKNRPELSGSSKEIINTGRVTRLVATGFGSREAAETACARLVAAGIGCLVPRN